MGEAGGDPGGSTLCSYTVLNFSHELASLPAEIGSNLDYSSVHLKGKNQFCAVLTTGC